MPVTIKAANVKYKSPTTGQYVGVNSVSDNTTAEQIAAITSAGQQQISAVQTKGQQTIASIPEDYTNLTNEVTDLKSAIDATGIIDLGNRTLQKGYMNSDNTINYTANAYFCIVDISKISKVSIKAGSTTVYCGFLRSFTYGSAVDFSTATGFTGRKGTAAGGTNNYDKPSDVNYLYIQMESNGSNMAPVEVVLDGYDIVSSAITNFTKQIGTLKTSITTNANAIAQEIIDRETADTGLQNAINAESVARLSADSTLHSEIETQSASIGSDVTALQTTLSAETTARSSADNALQTALTGKVPFPLSNSQPSYGTNGQILRTKGDGSTEWTDVGLPTDQQTQQAVDNWLDEHSPLYTIPDNSIPYSKLVKGTLKYATPEMYGAIGDGTTDDSAAIQQCINGNRFVFFGGSAYTFKDITITHDCVLVFRTVINPYYYDETKNVYHTLFNASNCNVIIDGLNVQGNYTNNTTENPEASHSFIKMSNGKITIVNSIFEHVNLTNRASTPTLFVREAAVLTAVDSDVYFENCEFSDFRKEEIIWVRCPDFSDAPISNVVITRCRFHNGYGYSLLNCYANHVTFTENIVENWDYYGSLCSTFAAHVVFNNNNICNNGFNNIIDTQEGTPGTWFPEDVAIIGNTIINNHILCDAIRVNAGYVNISNNIIVGGRSILKSVNVIPDYGTEGNATFIISNNYFKTIGYDNLNQKLLSFAFANSNVQRIVYLINNRVIGSTESPSYASIGLQNVDILHAIGNYFTAGSFSPNNTNACTWIQISSSNGKNVSIRSKGNMMAHTVNCTRYYYIVNSNSSYQADLITEEDSFDAAAGDDGYLLNVTRHEAYHFPAVQS